MLAFWKNNRPRPEKRRRHIAKKNKVLLARPNPFIVDEMKGFLENCGYEPVPIKDLNELGGFPEDEVAGAVVSTTVISSVHESAEGVVEALRQRFPSIPVTFASMLAEEDIEDMLKHKLEKVSSSPNVLSVKKGLLDHTLGAPDTFLVVTQDDLKDQALAGKIIEKQFPRQ